MNETTKRGDSVDFECKATLQNRGMRRGTGGLRRHVLLMACGNLDPFVASTSTKYSLSQLVDVLDTPPLLDLHGVVKLPS